MHVSAMEKIDGRNFVGTDPSAEAIGKVSLGWTFVGTGPLAEAVGKVSQG